MGWPQVIIIVLFTIKLVIHLLRSGEKHPYDPVAALINVGIYSGVLYWGGFWS